MFSKILKEKRKELNLTQQEVADQLNVTRQTISNWEVGKSYPDIPTLIDISNFYNLSLDYMLKGDAGFMNKIKKDSTELIFLRKMNLDKKQINFGVKTGVVGIFISLLIVVTMAIIKGSYELNIFFPVGIFIGNFSYGIFVSRSDNKAKVWLFLSVLFWLLAIGNI